MLYFWRILECWLWILENQMFCSLIKSFYKFWIFCISNSYSSILCWALRLIIPSILSLSHYHSLSCFSLSLSSYFSDSFWTMAISFYLRSFSSFSIDYYSNLASWYFQLLISWLSLNRSFDFWEVYLFLLTQSVTYSTVVVYSSWCLLSKFSSISLAYPSKSYMISCHLRLNESTASSFCY